MKKTYCFTNENGIFICFNQFESEDDFYEFIDFLKLRLGFSIENIKQSPYSITGDGNFNGTRITLMYDGFAGCCLRLELNQQALTDNLVDIIEKLD